MPDDEGMLCTHFVKALPGITGTLQCVVVVAFAHQAVKQEVATGCSHCRISIGNALLAHAHARGRVGTPEYKGILTSTIKAAGNNLPATSGAVSGFVTLLLADVAHNCWTLQRLVPDITTHVAAYVWALCVHMAIQPTLPALVVDAHGVPWTSLVVEAATVPTGLFALSSGVPEPAAITALGRAAAVSVVPPFTTATAHMRPAGSICLVQAIVASRHRCCCHAAVATWPSRSCRSVE